MKQALLFIFSIFCSIVFGEIKITTNSQHFNGKIFGGRIIRVVFYDSDHVGVFIRQEIDEEPKEIGVSFKGQDKFVGSSVAGSVGKSATLAKQDDGHFTFSVDD